MAETASGQGGDPMTAGGRNLPAPGGPQAKAHGCLCSVLANAAYRAGSVEDPCIDPRCPMHTFPSERA